MKDAKLTLTGIPVAVLIAFWMSMALRIPKEGSPGGVIAWLFPAFGDDLCPSSAVPLSWSLFADWLEWKNVEYAITNRRTVIRRGVWQVSELSRTHSDSPIEVRASTDGALGDAGAIARRSAMMSYFKLGANSISAASKSN